MNDQPVYIFADESCLGNQFTGSTRPGAAAGMIERFDERAGWHRRDFAYFEPDTTNNRMAIVSGIEGLRAVKHRCRVVFTSDSQYLVKGMKEWIHGWAAKGWRRKAGPIENLELWKRLCQESANHTVEWRWVRGHAGHPKNEYVNDLAVQAATDRRGIKGTVDSRFTGWLQEKQDRNQFLDFLDLPDDQPFSADRHPPTV